MSKNDSFFSKFKGGEWAVSAIVLGAALMAVVLRLNGRIWWCRSGDPAIYIHAAWNSSHTSQHLFDPYTFTHVLHGIILFWVIGWLFPRLGPYWRLAVASFAEMGWEILENSAYIIEKYRANTASVDYFGDSIANSVGDVIACMIGFWIASKLGPRRSLIFFLGVELVLLFWIRDGLLLNILQLIYPMKGITHWQMSM